VLGSALACFAADCLETASVLNTLQLIKKVVKTYSENAVLASAFGMLIFNLKESDLAEVSVIFSEWTAHWQSVAMDMSLSSSRRVAAVSGLSSLFGSLQINQMAGSFSGSKPSAEEGVKILKQLLNSQCDIHHTGNIYWNLGKLCFANKRLISNLPTVSDTLDYIGEDSLLNLLIHVMIQLGKEANQESGEILNIILRVLTDGPEEPLPPLNWKSILTPLVKIYIGTTTTVHILDFVLCSASSPTMASFLPSWLTPSVISSFTTDCKVRLYSCLQQLVDILSAKKFKDILEIGTRYFSHDEVGTKIAEAILDGLYSILKMSESPKSVLPYIKDTIEKIYHCCPSNLKMLLPKLAVCIQYLTADEIETLTAPKEETFVKSITIRREIILKNPSLRTKLLKPCVDFTLTSSKKYSYFIF
ncbi:focadhesin-like isoform X2, partial [Paramuricea clavata]